MLIINLSVIRWLEKGGGLFLTIIPKGWLRSAVYAMIFDILDCLRLGFDASMHMNLITYKSTQKQQTSRGLLIGIMGIFDKV
jgi:hypothetical protein